MKRWMSKMAVAAAAAMATLAGCRGNPATTRPATAIDPATTQPSYWMDFPPTDTVGHSDFDQLWKSCELALRQRQYPIARRDYRRGVITSEPVVSQQFFEPWRRDVGGGAAVAESSMATIRRTVRIEIARNDDGTFTAAPKVLVERYTAIEKKLRGTGNDDPTYWYPIHRDYELEAKLATTIRKALSK